MDSTPIKKSLRLTPRGKSLSFQNEETPKKVRFSMQGKTCINEEKKYAERLFSAEDALSMIQDSSLSDVETSSDEEWIVTKSKTISLSDSSKSKEKLRSQEAAKKKKDKEVVSPLKLLRKPEYEVNKLPSACKKSESAVSPIIIKRRTDVKTKDNDPSKALEALAPSSRNNIVSDTSFYEVTSRKSLLNRMPLSVEDNIENEFINKSTKPRKKETAGTHGKQKAGKKEKEKRKKNDLEKTLEDEIGDLHIETPKKNVESGTTGTKTTVIVEDVTFPNKNTVIQNVCYKSQTILTSPTPCTSTEETEEKTSEKNLKTPRRSSRKCAQVQVSDSDQDHNIAPSPPKRRSLRTPRPKTVTPLPVQRSSRKSSQKALSVTLSKEDSEMEISSPEKKTPKRSIRQSNVPAIEYSPSLRKQVLTPKVSAKKKLDLTSPISVKKISSGNLTPQVQDKVRRSIMGTPSTPMDEARAKLHTGSVPESLPCREEEFQAVFKFLSTRIADRNGGCLYISGVPGTGKTATVTAVIRSLHKEVMLGDLPDFDFVELNGLRLTDPRQAYVNIWYAISKVKVSGDIALHELERKFNGYNKKPCVILIDELDYLCNKRQDVIYNIFEWVTKSTAALSVLTIANTMDLAERTLRTKINSRMGLRKLFFKPYTFQQLERIVMDRIRGNSCFHPDAVQLVARKVAAVSGDARRALDICRRATDIVSAKGGIHVIEVSHIQEILVNIFSGSRIQAIQKLSPLSKLVLRAILSEVKRTGVEETTVEQVHVQLYPLCAFEGVERPVLSNIIEVCTSLAASGLILAEESRVDMQRKISLNVSEDDIHYALNTQNS